MFLFTLCVVRHNARWEARKATRSIVEVNCKGSYIASNDLWPQRRLWRSKPPHNCCKWRETWRSFWSKLEASDFFFIPISIVFQFIIVVSLFCACFCSKTMLQRTSIVITHFHVSNPPLVSNFTTFLCDQVVVKTHNFMKWIFHLHNFWILGKLTLVVGSNHNKIRP